MKVFRSEFCGGYGGGMILVAANSAEDALSVAARNAKEDYLFNHYDCDSGCYVQKVSDYLTEFKEVEGLVYTPTEPAVIAENIYIE